MSEIRHTRSHVHTRWVLVCRSQHKAPLLSCCSPGHVSQVTGAWTVLGTVSVTASGGPLPGWYFADLSLGLVQLLEEPSDLFESLLWLRVSMSLSSPGWFHTTVTTSEPRRGSFELGSWRQLTHAKTFPFCSCLTAGHSLPLTAQ